MKQRLLLVLLALFVSVGMVKAASPANTITITPLASSGEIKVTWTGETPSSSGQSATTSGKTLTFKTNGSTTNIVITGNMGGNTTGYTIDGIVGKVVADLADVVTSFKLSGTANELEITSANGITSLDATNLGLSKITITSATKLATLNLAGNKLNPSLTSSVSLSNLAASATKTWGTQTLDASGVSNLNAKGINLTSADFTGSGKTLEYLSTLSGNWTIGSWKKLNDSNKTYENTSEAQAIPNVTGAYAFYDNSKYYTDGTYSCQVTRGGVSIILTNIKINPALIKITIPASDKNGWGNEVMGSIQKSGVTVESSNCTAGGTGHVDTDVTGNVLNSYTCHQGDKVTVVATLTDANYEFNKFEVSSALVDEAHSTGTTVSTFTVKAKCMANNPAVQEDVTLKALFKGKDCKISYNESVINGSFYITDVNDNNKKIANNAIVEYGHKLEIQATPNDKYYASYKVGDEAPETANNKNTTNAKFKTDRKAEVFVDKDRTITVSFQTDDVTSNYTMNVQLPSDVADPANVDMKDIITTIQCGSETLTINSEKANVALSLGATAIKAGTSIPISVTVKEDKGYVVKSIQLGTQALNVINEGNNKFTANFTAPEDGNASFTIVVVKQATAKVYVDGKELSAPTALELDAAQTYTYDKQGHGLKYTTDPSGLTLKVLYKLSTLTGDAYYTTDLPTAAGKYNVKVSREADAYAAIAETEVKIASTNAPAIEITPATIAITTIPTVTAKLDTKTNRYSFVLSGGAATSLGENITSKGTFEVLSESNNGADINTSIDISNILAVNGARAYTDNLVPSNVRDQYINVAVRFKMKNDANYNPAATRVRVLVGKADDTKHNLVINSNIVTVDGTPSSVNTVQAEIYNGSTRVAYGKNTETKVSLGDGLKVHLRAIVDGYSTVKFIDKNPSASTKELTTTLVPGTTNTFETTTPLDLNGDYAFTIDLSGELKQVYKLETFDRVEVTYNGEPQAYASSNIKKITKNGADFAGLADLLKTSPIYYKDETGKVVTGGAPVAAGKYDVCIDIPASVLASDEYDAQTLTASQALQIVKKKPNVKWPTGVSRIGAGQKLSAAQLFKDGTADISGSFDWKDGTVAPKNGQFYTIKFIPDDTKNYETVELLATTQQGDATYKNLAITVSAKPIISIDESVVNGQFIVKRGNVEYHSGNEVEDGTSLTITPVANDGFACKTLIIDEAGTKHSYTGETTFKINGKSIYVTGEFELKSSYDPNTQYTVTLPAVDAVKGVVIGKPGVNAVAKGGSFAFTLSTLAADSANVVVKVDGTELKPVNGTYTINPVDANKTVTVALATPTKLKVSVPREVKNAGGYVMGKVEVEGLAADSTCYYGDEVTIVAFPESGVVFGGWSGAITSKEKLATFTVTEAMKIAPVFSGVPTGIEDLKATTTIRGEQGSIFFSCNGEAKVIIISMDGRTKVVEVSGETRIPMSTGVYGVVLEQGSQVIKQKVIVR